MADKPPASQTEHGLPIDLETAFTGADTVLRSLARSSVGLESARVGARTREAARIAAKYGADHPRAQAAAAAVTLQRGLLVESTRLAGRADVAPIDVGDNGVAITGRVIDPSGAGVPALTVQATDPRGRASATSRTDAKGQFRLVGGGKEEPGATERATERATSGTTGGDQGLILVVLDGKAELYRDAQAFTVKPGLVLYREIIVKR